MVSKIPFLLHAPAPGEVIAFKQPGYGLMIKRIEKITAEKDIFVLGTQPESLDSRIFGSIRPESLVGKVIWHIPKPRSSS